MVKVTDFPGGKREEKAGKDGGHDAAGLPSQLPAVPVPLHSPIMLMPYG
jgi:hypothetical protein